MTTTTGAVAEVGKDEVAEVRVKVHVSVPTFRAHPVLDISKQSEHGALLFSNPGQLIVFWKVL